MTTGSKIQTLRKTQNITQEQLADYLGVSRQSVSKWESDGAYPETDKLIKMGSLFKVSLDYLLREDYETTEQLSKKNDLMKFNTDAFVLVLLSFLGYVLGVTVVYITQKTLVGFLVIFGLIFMSAIIYIFRRSRFLAKSEFSDVDQNAIMKNTRMNYSADLVLMFLFVPLMIFNGQESITWFGPSQFMPAGILAFSSYIIKAIPFGLLGMYFVSGIGYFHKKKVMHKFCEKKPSTILICDGVTSSIGFVLFLVLFFAFEGIVVLFFLLVFVLILMDMIILPLKLMKKNQLKFPHLIVFLVSASMSIASLVLVTIIWHPYLELSLILSALNVLILLAIALKPFIASLKNGDTTSFMMIKNAFLIILLEGLSITYLFLYPGAIPDENVIPRMFLVFLSLFTIAGFYGIDRIFMKKHPQPGVEPLTIEGLK